VRCLDIHWFHSEHYTVDEGEPTPTMQL